MEDEEKKEKEKEVKRKTTKEVLDADGALRSEVILWWLLSVGNTSSGSTRGTDVPPPLSLSILVLQPRNVLSYEGTPR